MLVGKTLQRFGARWMGRAWRFHHLFWSCEPQGTGARGPWVRVQILVLNLPVAPTVASLLLSLIRMWIWGGGKGRGVGVPVVEWPVASVLFSLC